MPVRSRPAPLVLAALAALAAGCGTAEPAAEVPAELAAPAATGSPYERAEGALGSLLARCQGGGCAVPVGSGVEVDSVLFGDAVEVRFSRDLGDVPFRPATAEAFRAEVAAALAGVAEGRPVRVVTRGAEVSELVPNAFREPSSRDAARRFAPPAPGPPLVRRLDAPHTPTAGLSGRHVALWPSHGWYYEPALDRWEWQRPRLFTTVEDLNPFGVVTRYVTPALERAGAVVLMPRERDAQPHEVVADNDGVEAGEFATPGTYAETGRWRSAGPGFAWRPPYGDGENPFRLGTAREADAASGATATWTASVPEAGEYHVVVSYAPGPDRTDEAVYTVRHAGGETRLAVNQRMGAGTWAPLGAFRFEPGGPASVTLAASGEGTVSADAVRWGGGVGVVARAGETSGRPRFTEAARYYEQLAGAPEYVYNLSGPTDADYTDDYRSRGEWVNWLRGAPYGPNERRDDAGLGIPVDLSLAFHTDAGVARRDTVIGTLVIYDVPGMDSTRAFPDGVSRLANRDLADGLQTALVDDLRDSWDAAWRRRPLWDRPYSEAARPNVPSVLLELLSHQSFLDMRFALDPRFQADVGRTIYKAVGRFLAEQRGEPFVVQPLAPTHFAATFEGDDVRLGWRAQPDPLEPSASADAYVVYVRDGRAGWDGGRLVEGTEVMLEAPPPGVVRSYRVAAVNAGGESRPSEALAVGLAASASGAEPALVVAGFDRVAPPAAVSRPGFAGFAFWRDQGVPDGVDVATVGDQVVFDPSREWADDDAPGWGASEATLETTRIAGNTHDFAAVHGRVLLAAGRSFASVSDEAVADGAVPLTEYPLVDLILGEERRTPWPKADGRPPAFEAIPTEMRDALGAYLDGGGRLIVSGAHWATDLAAELDGTPRADDDPAVAWLRDALGVRWRTDRAAQTGAVVASGGLLAEGDSLAYNAVRGPEVYAAESPDAIEPAGDDGRTALRYAENSLSAAVLTPQVAAFGFPLETVLDTDRLAALVAATLDALER
jgi:hypothetical protein